MVAFDVKRRMLTLFPVLPKPEVVFNGQTVADRSIYCIKVEKEVGYCEFINAVSVIFLLPVSAYALVGFFYRLLPSFAPYIPSLDRYGRV